MTIIQHGFKSAPHQFTISESADIFDLMSDALYSDRFKAIVRELSTNAVDAQIEANNMVPFHVHLPTIEDPSFWIRDFGIGLSTEDIKKVYCSYFESTKRTDDKLTGQFGLGSKTPLAYVNSFTVTSYFNGQRNRWIVRRNDRIPEIYEEQQPSSTDQHNGLKIQFAVPPKDHCKFYTAAAEVYPYLELQPNFIGCDFAVRKPVYTLFNTGKACTWGIGEERKSRIVMGGVAYALSDEFNQYQIDLYVPNGTFKMTPSRESLRYIDDTKKKIHELIEAAAIEAHSILDTLYNEDFESLFDETKWLDSISVSNSSICDTWMRKMHNEHTHKIHQWHAGRTIQITWVNNINIAQNSTQIKHEKKKLVDQKIKDRIYNLAPKADYTSYEKAIHEEPFEYVFMRQLTRNRSGNYKFQETDCIRYNFAPKTGQTNDITLVVHDGTVKNRINAIANAYRIDTNRNIYLLNVNDPQFIEDIKEFGLPCEVKLLSELPVPPPEPKSKKSKDPNHVAVPRSVGCFAYNEKSCKYETHNDLTGVKYFIPLKTDGNTIVNDAGLSQLQRNVLDALLKLIRNNKDEIIYIKEQYLDRYTTLENFFDHARSVITKILANDKRFAEAVMLGHYAVHYTDWNFRKVCETLREITMCEYNKTITSSEKPKINSKILKHPIFASWVGSGVTTIQQGITKFVEQYNVIELYCPGVLKPYDKEFQKKLRVFRNQNPYLFFDHHQIAQHAFKIDVNPFKIP